MKIAITKYAVEEIPGGDNTRARMLCEALKTRYEVTLITPSFTEIERADTIAIHVPRGGSVRQAPSWTVGLLSVCLKSKFDIVCCSNDWLGFPACYLASKIKRYKLLYDAGAILSEGVREHGRAKFFIILAKILERFIAKHCDMVIAASENTFSFYRKYNRNIKLITNPIDTEHFKFDENSRKKWRRYYGIPEDKKIIGLIGPFSYGGLDRPHPRNSLFLEFLYRNLSDFNENTLFMVIGECPALLKIRTPRVIYTDYVEDLVGHLSCLDAVLVPTTFTTTGPFYKILEPMSVSLPVFTTPQGTVGLYYVEGGRDIFVFEKAELTENVNRLIYNERLLRRVGNNARQVIEKYYSKNLSEAKMLEILAELHG